MLRRRDFLAISGAGTAAALALSGRPSIGLAQSRSNATESYGPRAALVRTTAHWDAKAVNVLLEIDVEHLVNADFDSMRTVWRISAAGSQKTVLA